MTDILLVEDSLPHARAARDALERGGWTVKHVTTVEEAKAWLREHEPRLAIIDLMMPHNLEGLTLCNHLKNHMTAVKRIVLTARGEWEVLRFAQQSADVVLEKVHITPQSLRDEVQKLIGGRS